MSETVWEMIERICGPLWEEEERRKQAEFEKRWHSMQVLTKRDHSLYYQAGAYGNKLRTWDSLEEMAAEGYQGAVSIRYLAPGKQYYDYAVPNDMVQAVVKQFVERGAKTELFRFGETAPDELIVIQGECWDGEYPFRLRYSHDKTMNRIAMANSQYENGWKARLMLQHHMTPSSYEDLMALFEQFPKSVIEFSTFSCTLGNIPGRNTVIWEVRNY